jgi:hypothetical protein
MAFSLSASAVMSRKFRMPKHHVATGQGREAGAAAEEFADGRHETGR